MRRREFIAVLAGAAVTRPFAVTAQEKLRRIGVLEATKENDPDGQSRVKKFRDRLEQLGWKDGRDLHIEYRWYAGDARLADTYAAELVSLGMDVILAVGTPPTAALKKNTQTLPIVFTVVADPVGAGFVNSLAHPGSNITGFTTFEPSMAGKWLELLKQAAPDIRRVAPVFNPETAPVILMPSVEAAAPSFALQLIPAPVHDRAEIERTIASFAQQPHGSLLVFPDSFPFVHRDLIVEFANRYRLPTMYPFPVFVVSGGLMSYGVDIPDLLVRAADYVDRILKGAKPSALPVQQPNKFQFAINLKTAKALDLELSPTLLAQADEVIE